MSKEKKIFSKNPTKYLLYTGKDDLSKKWFVYYYKGGKRVRKYGDINQYKTIPARVRAAKSIIRKLKQGEDTEGKKAHPLHLEIMEVFERKASNYGEKTYQTHLSKIEKFFDFLGGRKLSIEIVEAFFNRLQVQRHQGTYNGYLYTLKMLFKEIGREAVFSTLKPLQAVFKPARYFQIHQIKRLKEYIKKYDPELWLHIEFMYYCFIRPRRELRLLKVGDIYFSEKKILIRSENSKNKKSEFVRIPDAFMSSIEHLSEYPPNSFVFTSPLDASKPTSYNYFYARFRKVLDDLGFSSEYKLYSWKHTGAVAAVKAGINIKELQLQLRHHSLDQVNQYLRQLGVNDMTELAEKFPSI